MKCECCGTAENLTRDHKRPKSRGGQLNRRNIGILCRECNKLKGDKIISYIMLKKFREAMMIKR